MLCTMSELSDRELYRLAEPPLSNDERAGLMYACQRLEAGRETVHDISRLADGMWKVLMWMQGLDDE